MRFYHHLTCTWWLLTPVLHVARDLLVRERPREKHDMPISHVVFCLMRALVGLRARRCRRG